MSPGGIGDTGTLAITGAYTQGASATLAIELGGLAPSQFDRLLVGGAANLSGSLNVLLIDGFTPPPGQSYNVLTYASRNGALTGSPGFAQDYQTTGLS